MVGRMSKKRISIAGISTLLGQNFAMRILQTHEFTLESMHDEKLGDAGRSLSDVCDWSGAESALDRLNALPLLPADAPSRAPTLVSFLPDSLGEHVESRHLARGTRVITHCEYARLTAPLLMPGVAEVDSAPVLTATPNCTTAICAPPLARLDQAFKIKRATITTLQAISGTDLPGMPASAIHDQVVGHLPSEAEALSHELSILFGSKFPIDTFATRVPVWRGHTITMALDLEERPDAEALKTVLGNDPEIGFQNTLRGRRQFLAKAPLTTVTNLRCTERGALLVIEGDNLETATVGVMLKVLQKLRL